MSREIKFRAWDGKKMHFNCVVGNGQVVYIPDAIGEYRWHNQAEVTPMQFTGLKDRNGTEYCEGDILKTNGGRLGSVAYHDERGLWIFHDTENFNEALHEYAASSEIIGNIHEHKHLLQTSKTP